MRREIYKLFDKTLERLDRAYIDSELRKFKNSRAILAVDTNIVLDVLENRKYEGKKI
ncbi:MAG: hypothetical protein QXY24_02295 [Candidatus Aenigmatarchaeota archaeon]